LTEDMWKMILGFAVVVVLLIALIYSKEVAPSKAEDFSSKTTPTEDQRKINTIEARTISLHLVQGDRLGSSFADVTHWLPSSLLGSLKQQHPAHSFQVVSESTPPAKGSVVVYLKKMYARLNQDMTEKDDLEVALLAKSGACLVSIVFLEQLDNPIKTHVGMYEKGSTHDNIVRLVHRLQKPQNGGFDDFNENREVIVHLVGEIEQHCLSV